MLSSPVFELDAKQIRVALVSSDITCIVFNQFDNLTSSVMILLEVGITFVRNVDTDPISDLESFHWGNRHRAGSCSLRSSPPLAYLAGLLVAGVLVVDISQ